MIVQLLEACGIKVVAKKEINKREVVIVSSNKNDEVIWQAKSEDYIDSSSALEAVLAYFKKKDHSNTNEADGKKV